MNLLFAMQIAVHLQNVSAYLKQFNVSLDYKEKGSVRQVTTEQIAYLMRLPNVGEIFTSETIAKVDILLKQGTPMHKTFLRYITF